MKELLEREYSHYNQRTILDENNLDPIMVAKEHNSECIALICGLFAYGNVGQIVKFLRSLDFSFLEKDPDFIRKQFKNHYYRFQKPQDIIEFFLALKKLKEKNSLEEIFYKGYRKENSVLEGLEELITALRSGVVTTRGLDFLLGKPPLSSKGNSPMKRWNMFLRWMVRKDNIDLGLWSKARTKDLLIPLDTHTFKVATSLGLLHRKSYDLKSVLLLTNRLKEFDENDPVKYDFSLYNLGKNKKYLALR